MRGELPGPGTYRVDIIGESRYQDALREIAGGNTVDGVEKFVKAVLVLEDGNQFDPMAVRVDIDGKTVGYLSRENARQYRAQLTKVGDPRLTGLCGAVIRGGRDQGRQGAGHLGVKLDLPSISL